MEPKSCSCPMRDGAHEWFCGPIGEYEYTHCKRCDKAVWMCEVAESMCRDCRKLFGMIATPVNFDPNTGTQGAD